MPSQPQRDIDRRRQMRISASRSALLRVGVLSVPVIMLDVSGGGLFVSSHVLVETGELGQLEMDGADPVGVRVIWTRGSTHPMGQGLGLAFEVRDLREERRVLELVLTILDGG